LLGELAGAIARERAGKEVANFGGLGLEQHGQCGRVVFAPDAFSVRIFSQPARWSASSCNSGDWSLVLTLAYQTRIRHLCSRNSSYA
jgi:hypothetical protein